MYQVEDEPIQTTHLYVVRDDPARPSYAPIVLSLFTLSLLILVGFLTPYSQPIVRIACLDRAGKQSRVVDARQLADMAGVVEHLDPGRLRQEHPHHRLAALAVPAEIIERIVVAPFDNRACGG